MTELDDHELLAEYARSESEAAFAALVARYVNLVYSAGLRFTGNPHHAEEITQAVFIILARKAGSLRRGTVLSGWLYQTARLTAANFVKGEIRRRHREQEVYMQSTLTEPEPAAWEQIAPLLDEAMGRLGDTDRNAVVLRFFENKTARQVATALKLSEAAAHKRVNRALDKLRKLFSKRGVSSTTTIIAGAISTHSVQAAPVALAKSVIAVAVAKGAAASTSTLTLVKGALKLMAWTKAKTSIMAGAAVILAASTTTVVTQHLRATASGSFNNVHIRGQLRTPPADNFSAIIPEANFVTIELWKEFEPKLKWRVEKPGRVAVMDGQSTLFYLKPSNLAMKVPHPAQSAFDTDWLHKIANLSSTMTNEIQSARAKGWKVNLAEERAADGQAKSVVTVEAKAGLPDNNYFKNKSFDTSDTRRVYRFDAQTKRLEAVQVYLVDKSGEVLIFKANQIDYNQPIDPAVFHLDLPANVNWYQEPKKLPDNEKYAAMTATQAARAFFEACSREDWNEVTKFWDRPIDDRIKQHLGGLEIVSLGEAFAAKPYPGQFVPYEIRLRDGTVKKHNLSIRNDNPVRRWLVDGGL